MARGWESKAIESQQNDRRGERAAPARRYTPEAQARARERERLRLSRACLAGELDLTTAPVRQQALRDALARLDAELRALEETA